jgi:hypothetical protein
MSKCTADSVRDTLLGAWELVGCEFLGTDGSINHPFGSDAIGLLVYDGESERVSAQLVRADLPRFASDDWRQAEVEEMAAAWPSYFGYFGTFRVDSVAATVTHHIESGWFPNLVGTDQIRRYTFEADDRLVLDADTSWGRVRIIWRKLGSGAAKRSGANR